MRSCNYLSQFIIALIALCGSLTMSAQESSPRSAGYRGSLTLTDQYLAIIGFETSHGYMFNEHHYLGAGVGGFFIPTDNLPCFGQVFADYRAYLSDKASTMVLPRLQDKRGKPQRVFLYERRDIGAEPWLDLGW